MNSVISLNNVYYSYKNGHQALSDITLDIPAGKKIALIGHNGAGKSTLLWLLNGLFKPESGTLSYLGTPYRYSGKHLRTLRQHVGLLFGHPDEQLFAPSVYEEVSFGLMNMSDDKAAIRSKTEAILAQFGLTALARQSPHQLSAGQKKKVCLAAIIAMEPDVLVADEPAAHLDKHYEALLFEKLEALNQSGKTILYTTHDIDQAYSWADYFVLIHEGKVMLQAPATTFFDQQEVLKSCLISLPTLYKVSNLLNLTHPVKTMEALEEALKKNN